MCCRVPTADFDCALIVSRTLTLMFPSRRCVFPALMHLRHLVKGAGAPGQYWCGTQRACSTLIQSLLWFRICNLSLSSVTLCFSIRPPWFAAFISFHRITFSRYCPSLASFLYLLKASWPSCTLENLILKNPARGTLSSMRVRSQKPSRGGRDQKHIKHLLSTDWWIT